MEKIYTTVGVYRNLDFVVNGVHFIDLEKHIEYNMNMRFGRALLVEGKVVHKGYFSDSDVEMLEEKFGNKKADRFSEKYH